jgi:diguanylate cyclase (GGDEF)-like protein
MANTDRDMLDALGQRLDGDPAGARLLEWVGDLSSSLRSLDRELKKQKIDFTTILEIAHQVNSKGLDLSRIESYTLTMVRGQFGVRDAMVLRQDAFASETISISSPKNAAAGGFSFPAEGAFARLLVQIGRPSTRTELAPYRGEYAEVRRLEELGMEFLVPLVHSGTEGARDLLGALCLGPKIGARPFTEEDRNLAQVLAGMVAISLHNAQLYHRSIVDGLTQVYSRGHFDAHLLQEIARARRFHQKDTGAGADAKVNQHVSLVMVDIDHFKQFNDRHGHQVGDLVLQTVAHTLHEAVRTMDIVARYGGEEFSLIFPETRKEDAARIAERLRRSVAETAVDAGTGEPLRVTISLGVATFPQDARDIRELIAKADQAMYRAKGNGRNQVVAAPDGEPKAREGS